MSIEANRPDANTYSPQHNRCGPGHGGVDCVGLPHAKDDLEGIIDILNEKVVQNEMDPMRAAANADLVEAVMPSEHSPYDRSAELVAMLNIDEAEKKLGLVGRNLPQGGLIRFMLEQSADGEPNNLALDYVDSEQISQEIRRAARSELVYGGESTVAIPIEDPEYLDLSTATANVADAMMSGLISQEQAGIWAAALNEVALCKVNPTYDMEVRYDENDVPHQVIVKRSKPQDD